MLLFYMLQDIDRLTPRVPAFPPEFHVSTRSASSLWDRIRFLGVAVFNLTKASSAVDYLSCTSITRSNLISEHTLIIPDDSLFYFRAVYPVPCTGGYSNQFQHACSECRSSRYCLKIFIFLFRAAKRTHPY